MCLPRWPQLRFFSFSFVDLILQQLAVLSLVGVVDRTSVTPPPPD
jgi:hypothetical protein